MPVKKVPTIALKDNEVTLTLAGEDVTLTHAVKVVPIERAVVAALRARGATVADGATREVHAWIAADTVTVDLDGIDGVDLSGLGLEDGETLDAVEKFTRGYRVAREEDAPLPIALRFQSDAFGVDEYVDLIPQGRLARAERRDGKPTGVMIPRADIAVGVAEVTRPNNARYILTVKVVPSGDHWTLLARLSQ